MTHLSTVADTLDAGHTPGPWKLTVHTGDGRKTGRFDDWSISGADGASVCFEGKPNARAHANTALIVAAPDLIEALEAFVAGEIDVSGTALIYDADVRAMQQLARSAIAKARGEVQP